tara:strand:+ start:2687 stop:4255 length:1569 start_codon:yes stop_codon:yes gene_type:complete
MIIINSAAYVIPEFCNEFGLIPPCFLPIANNKLLIYQVETLRKQFSLEQEIILSLPQDYELSINEANLIKSLAIRPIFVPKGITLGMALLYVLNTVGYSECENLHLLHGDTLIEELPQEKNIIALAKPQDDYAWEYEESSKNKLIWCGYFSFTSARSFVRALATTQGNFTESVHLYIKEMKGIVFKEVENWYDLGHVNTYFRSRSAITTQRAFNSLKIKDGVVWKTGNPSIKIEAEAAWFLAIPSSLRRFTPQMIQVGKNKDNNSFYGTEYLPYLPLNEIFVHGKNSAIFWENIVNLISTYMKESRCCFKNETNTLEKIYLDSVSIYKDKTYQRLDYLVKQKSIDLDKLTKYDSITLPSIRDITEECVSTTLNLPVVPAVVHGDLCFSNIMYDSRMNVIKVIDPRGLNNKQELTIYGNQTYDLAKLCHSLIGLYDFIIADEFELIKSENVGYKLIFNVDSRIEEIQEIFLSKSMLPEIANGDVIAPTILLFLSMIPLHFDNPARQEAMLANALRLYSDWKAI